MIFLLLVHGNAPIFCIPEVFCFVRIFSASVFVRVRVHIFPALPRIKATDSLLNLISKFYFSTAGFLRLYKRRLELDGVYVAVCMYVWYAYMNE